ncbi:head-tail connector protein [Galactobacillus timonensis]|uniref:head-tail connector protein n=1 Tax=Galactobacillus timonensis TaxID=2041840 RepID=UPI000C82B571|nr:head-tail connector protein [Galactobacillus timonensis]
MTVSLDEMKTYLRVDGDEEDALIASMIQSAEALCGDILRSDTDGVLADTPAVRAAVMYTVAYLFENREDPDYHQLVLMLRAVLFGERKAVF